jgi:N6-adenosine-specific RNA methylase IME4
VKYRTIVADPPWPLRWNGGGYWRVNGRGERQRSLAGRHRSLPYPSMSIDAIAALQVADLAEADAHLYLWIPDRFLIEGIGAVVARAWGFEPGRLLIWRKAGFGLGTFPRPQHEALIVCRRGSLPFQVRNAGSVQDWRLPYEGGTRVHSRKPEGAMDLIEQASPGPRVELFSRRHRLGWDVWGNESANTATLELSA